MCDYHVMAPSEILFYHCKLVSGLFCGEFLPLGTKCFWIFLGLGFKDHIRLHKSIQERILTCMMS